MTEAELRDALEAEERKLVERERQAEEELRKNPERSTTERDDDGQPTENYPAEAHIDNASQNSPEKRQRRRSEPNRPLSEKELRDVISQQVREMNEAEKRARGATPSKSKDSGLEFGFD